MTRDLSGGGVSLQEKKASLAEPMALSISSSVVHGASQRTSCVAGFRTSIHFFVVLLTELPPIKRFNFSVIKYFFLIYLKYLTIFLRN